MMVYNNGLSEERRRGLLAPTEMLVEKLLPLILVQSLLLHVRAKLGSMSLH